MMNDEGIIPCACDDIKSEEEVASAAVVAASVYWTHIIIIIDILNKNNNNNDDDDNHQKQKQKRFVAKCNNPFLLNGPHLYHFAGDLLDKDRDENVTNLQISLSGKLPSPSSVGKSDVASLALASLRRVENERNISVSNDKKNKNSMAFLRRGKQIVSLYLDAATVAVVWNLKILTTAILYRWGLGRLIRNLQWLAI